MIRDVSNWFNEHYHELKQLNPGMPILLRTGQNCMPAVTTELDFTTHDLLQFMIQNSLFRDSNGTVSESRVEAAKAYLDTDYTSLQRLRWSSPGYDPGQPFADRSAMTSAQASDLSSYFAIKDAMEEQMKVIQSGPDEEFRKAENALLQCQRVDLWCAGENEVEAAVKHLSLLGQKFNSLEVDMPTFIEEYYPGARDL